jgi:hypothetical protein
MLWIWLWLDMTWLVSVLRDSGIVSVVCMMSINDLWLTALTNCRTATTGNGTQRHISNKYLRPLTRSWAQITGDLWVLVKALLRVIHKWELYFVCKSTQLDRMSTLRVLFCKSIKCWVLALRRTVSCRVRNQFIPELCFCSTYAKEMRVVMHCTFMAQTIICTEGISLSQRIDRYFL